MRRSQMALAKIGKGQTTSAPRRTVTMSRPVTQRGSAAALLLGAFLGGCAEAPAHTEALSLPSSREHWRENGFVEMVPTFRPPTTADESDLIEVWVRLPEGARWTSEWSESRQRHLVRLPEGTDADRLELHRDRGTDRIVDVRGTSFGAGGREIFRVLRLVEDSLEGVAFERNSSLAQSEADDMLARIMRRAGAGQREIARVVALNRCASCHFEQKPESTTPTPGLPNRGTDFLGLYGVQSVLANEEPIETSRPKNLNFDRAHVTAFCSNAPGTGPRCQKDRPDRMRIDFARAVADGEVHAKRVCESRRFLFDRADAKARQDFVSAFQECGIDGAEPLTETNHE